jgi:hypothetical protein
MTPTLAGDLMRYVDLHVHTTASDGMLTPSEVVQQAKEAGLVALGIADHDTLGGVPEGCRAGKEAGIEVVPGVEINTEENASEIHVLGYWPELDDEEFNDLLKMLRDSRQLRLDEMVSRLARLGLVIDASRVREVAGDAAPGRPHVARVLAEAGLVRSVREAFDLYLGMGKPAYVERYRVSPVEAVAAVVRARGVPVLAHPGLLPRDEILPRLLDAGLAGLEVYHPYHDEGTVRVLLEEAGRHGLLVTGGSDSHGKGEEHSGAVGEVRVPYEHLEALKTAKCRIMHRRG